MGQKTGSSLLAELYPNGADDADEDFEKDAGDEDEEGEVDLSQVPDEQLHAILKEAESREFLSKFAELSEETGVEIEKLAEQHVLGIVQADAAFDRRLWRFKQAGLLDPAEYVKIAHLSGGTVYDDEFTPLAFTDEEFMELMGDDEE